MEKNRLLRLIVFTLVFCQAASGQQHVEYDLVLAGGRVMDPETRLDAIRNVGIIGNRIAQVSSEPLKGKEIVDVSGLVVAPGFIDLHIHGRDNLEQQYQLHDGVTTALELEWGIENLKAWYASRESRALINYGASVCWPYERFKSLSKYREEVDAINRASLRGESSITLMTNTILPAAGEPITGEEMRQTLANIRASLEEGGIGIGVPIGYLPESNPSELFRVYQLAGELQAPIFTHTRYPNILAIQEALANAVLTGAPLHLVHINSMALGNIQVSLDMVAAAQQKGLDITTEVYPYTAASTGLQSAMFDAGWQERLGIGYGDLQWVATGERLTQQTFDTYRKEGGIVIIHMMKPEWIRTGIAAPGVMIASDGMPYAKLAHPRTAGTFARVLGKYVREENVIDLMGALEKMTLLPAIRLEGIAPMMRFKGRIQAGADADITIFNPGTIRDKATFEGGLAFSEGVEYVLVNGTFVLKNGREVSGTYPGQPVYGRYKQ
ncbi:amidohydrolase family protein [Robiginitalea marina]|uniref:Amidohydrolase family protein n=1 Tax=Robiginitalea marina TaxID=2954105 RepID=A0ABT1AZW9_9FLAO|nr:amidohydrolase family protein [Robiginitalea marina]MCO5725596.1 amidohydrolase family protein [Robiginitalea marina]